MICAVPKDYEQGSGSGAGPLSTCICTAGAGESKGRVVFDTIKGDIHDIGKDLVVGMLRSAGYEVTDLGVDVPVQNFVDAVREKRPSVLGLSGLLTIAFDAMKETIDAVTDAGLRPDLKAMIGGGPVDEKVRGYTGADAWGKDPQAVINLYKEWIRSCRSLEKK
jgi:methanogenic corrinoid protein MtbC1